MTQQARIYIVALLVIASMLGMAIAYASDITDADFSGTITVTNNSSSANTSISTNVTGLNSSDLISGGYLNSSANNCAIQGTAGADIAFMPGYEDAPWWLWVDSVNAIASLSDIFYVKNVSGGKIRYFPGVTGMTVNSTSLELGDNFSMEIKSYIDVSTPYRVIAHKQSSFAVATGNVSGNITAGIVNGRDLLYDDAASQYCNKAAGVVSPSGGNLTLDAWFMVDALGINQMIISAGDAGTKTMWFLLLLNTNQLNFRIGDGAASYCVDWTSSNTVMANKWYFVTARYNNAASPKTEVYVNGDQWGGVDNGVGGNIAQPNTHLAIGTVRSGAAYQYYFSGYIDEVRVSSTARTLANHVNAYNNGLGVPFSVDTSTTSLWHFNEGGGNPADETGTNNLTRQNAPTWSTISPVLPWSGGVSLGGLSSGEKEIVVKADSINLWMTINGATSQNVSIGSGIPNNSSNWSFGSLTATPYIEEISITINGTQQGYWYWEYGSTFTDHSPGGGHTATPSFRTTRSDENITAKLSSFTPTNIPKAPPFAVGEGPDFISTNITTTANFTTGNVTKTYPGEDIIKSLTDTTGVPYQIPSTYIATFVILFCSMATSYFLKAHAAQSFFAKSMVNIVAYGVAVGLGIYDWWMIILFFIFEVAFWLASEHRTKG